MSVPDIVNHGTMTGRAITDIWIANGRIGSLGNRKQVMDRCLAGDLDMARQTISFYPEGDNVIGCWSNNLLMTA